MIKEYRQYSNPTKAQQFVDSIHIFENNYGTLNPINILKINNLITILKNLRRIRR